VYVVVDSSFVIDHLRGDPGAVARWRELFEAGDTPVATAVVVCEVAAGLRAQDEHHLLALLGPAEFVQPGPEIALAAGRWRAAAHVRGARLGLADALIAASASALGAAVLTRNVRDFVLTPVRVETY
jgi:predicted nucleic acid-binding protein